MQQTIEKQQKEILSKLDEISKLKQNVNFLEKSNAKLISENDKRIQMRLEEQQKELVEQYDKKIKDIEDAHQIEIKIQHEKHMINLIEKEKKYQFEKNKLEKQYQNMIEQQKTLIFHEISEQMSQTQIKSINSTSIVSDSSNTLSNLICQLKSQKEHYEGEIQEIKKKSEEEKHSLKQEIELLKSKLNQFLIEKKEFEFKMHANFDSKIKSACQQENEYCTSQHKIVLRNMQELHDSAINELEEKIETLSRALNERTIALKNEKEKNKERKQDYEEIIDNLKEQMQKLRENLKKSESLSSEHEQKEKAYLQQISDLKSKIEQEVGQLKENYLKQYKCLEDSFQLRIQEQLEEQQRFNEKMNQNQIEFEEISKQKYEQLNFEYNEIMEYLNNREPRLEDIQLITFLKNEIQNLQEELKYLIMEVINREEMYNKFFSNSQNTSFLRLLNQRYQLFESSNQDNINATQQQQIAEQQIKQNNEFKLKQEEYAKSLSLEQFLSGDIEQINVNAKHKLELKSPVYSSLDFQDKVFYINKNKIQLNAENKENIDNQKRGLSNDIIQKNLDIKSQSTKNEQKTYINNNKKKTLHKIREMHAFQSNLYKKPFYKYNSVKFPQVLDNFFNDLAARMPTQVDTNQTCGANIVSPQEKEQEKKNQQLNEKNVCIFNSIGLRLSLNDDFRERSKTIEIENTKSQKQITKSKYSKHFNAKRFLTISNKDNNEVNKGNLHISTSKNSDSRLTFSIRPATSLASACKNETFKENKLNSNFPIQKLNCKTYSTSNQIKELFDTENSGKQSKNFEISQDNCCESYKKLNNNKQYPALLMKKIQQNAQRNQMLPGII